MAAQLCVNLWLKMVKPRRKRFEIRKKRTRRRKLKKLGERLLEAKTEAQKKKLREKIKRTTPHQSASPPLAK